MTQDPTKPTTHERYGRALESTHLEVNLERVGDVDLLVAAGWVREGLGTALYRTMLEFDAARGEHRLAWGAFRAADSSARRRLRLAKTESERVAARAEILSARNAALTAKALALAQLKTLAECRRTLASFAIRLATIERYMQGNAHVVKLSGQALSHWLDPLCPHCDGRAFTGGYMAPLVWCPHCEGGRRSLELGNTHAATQFGRLLMNRMDSKTDYVGRRMRQFLRRDAAPNDKRKAAEAELQQRLQVLRSAESQED